jgi:hypothetical protein
MVTNGVVDTAMAPVEDTLRMVELYFHHPKRLRGFVLNYTRASYDTGQYLHVKNSRRW